VTATGEAATKARDAVAALKERGWRNQEIATVLGVTPGRVSQLTSTQRKATARLERGE
jgi:predicted transcriptional regulator